jgi:hypothetical protein
MKHTLNLLLLLITINTRAQTTERIQINVGNFMVPQKEGIKHFFYPFIRNIGGSYIHQFDSRFSLRASYNQWFRLLNIGLPVKIHLNGYYEPFKQPQDLRIGDIDRHFNYGAIDLEIIYQLLPIKRHELYTGVGISYTWGKYSKYTSIYNHPGYPDWVASLTTTKHYDLGLIAELGYNYMIFKNRVNIGISETVKGYTSLPFQFYTNVNLGYNFNWGMKKKTAQKK